MLEGKGDRKIHPGEHKKVGANRFLGSARLAKGSAVPAGKDERRAREVDSPAPKPHALRLIRALAVETTRTGSKPIAI
jgi:hypothetical protein